MYYGLGAGGVSSGGVPVECQVDVAVDIFALIHQKK